MFFSLPYIIFLVYIFTIRSANLNIISQPCKNQSLKSAIIFKDKHNKISNSTVYLSDRTIALSAFKKFANQIISNIATARKVTGENDGIRERMDAHKQRTIPINNNSCPLFIETKALSGFIFVIVKCLILIKFYVLSFRDTKI